MARTLGRNDPCSCGSGRKYKRCCLPQDEAERVNQLRASGAIMGGPETSEGKLRRRIVRFFEEELPEPYRYEALCAWEGKPKDYDGPFETSQEDTEWLAFMDYLVHDFIATGYDAPTLELFYRQRGSRLPPDERRLLECWRDNHIGFYEVQQVKQGIGWMAKDLMFGEECFVSDISTSRQLERWDIVAGRFLREPDRFTLGGTITVIPRLHQAAILKQVRDAWAGRCPHRTKASFQQFMKASWPAIRRMIDEQARRLPELHTGTGEGVLLCRTWYEVRDHAKVRRQLKTIPGIQYMGPHEDPMVEGQRFDWVVDQPLSGQRSSEGGLTLQTTLVTPEGKQGGLVLGNLTLLKRELEVFCLSKERLERLTGMLEQQLGSAIHRKGTMTQRVEEALEQRQHSDEKAHETMSSIPPHVQKTLMRKFLRQYYTRWVDTPIPALDGLTPRQAAKEPGYQARLHELLKDFEHTERNAESATVGRFSPTRLIRKLLQIQIKGHP